MSMHRISAALTLLLAAVGPQAAEAPPQSLACRACHGPEGVSSSADIPNLAGQKSAYLAKQLRAFRDGTRKNDLMAAIAGQLGDEDIRTLVAYWSGLPAGGTASAGTAPGTVTAAAPSPAARSRVTFPADFPAGFTEYRREDDPTGKTTSRSFANAPALRAARDGQPLPDGSAIYVVTYAARLGSDGQPQRDAQGLVADKVMSYSAMASATGWGDEIPTLLRNGNWNYALFAADGTPRNTDLQPRCLACHKPRVADSFVFTIKELQTRAKAS